MDKKLLDALNNLSIALGDIAQALADKSEATSATAKAMKGGDFISEIKEINVGVKQLQKDTKQILSNQQTIMKMAETKSKDSKTSDVEGLGKDKTSQKNFKEGIGVILLIAVAVLALGVAFNLVGKVNFLSVVALSLALPLLAIGFAKVLTTLKEVGFNAKEDSKNFLIAIGAIALSITMASWILQMIIPLSFSKAMTATFIAVTFALLAPSISSFMTAFKGLTWMEIAKGAVSMVIILPAMALGLAFASWAFQLIRPIGIAQFLTAVGISVAFVVISFGLKKMLESFKDVDLKTAVKDIVLLPLVLPAVALGIALSSYAFQLIKPVGLSQMFTAVFISVAFTVIAYGLNKILTSFKDISPEQAIEAAIMIPILFVGISYAIAFSSIAFSKIVPISFTQFLTAVGIAAVFVVISLGLKLMTKAISQLNWKDVLLIPALYSVISVAIFISSAILSKTTVIPLSTLTSILAFSITIAGAVVAMGGAVWLLTKMGLGIKDAVIGGLLTVIISTAIMVSSHILALGNYKDYPDWKWALGVGLSLLAFAPAMVALGLISMSGVGALALLAGAAAVLGVAGTIVVTSHILSSGKYTGGPPLWWSMSTALSLTAFTAGMVLLGGMIVASFGLGALALAAGSKAVLTVAQTIVDTSFILQKGKYVGGPTKEWAEGISLALGAFSPVYGMLMANKIMSLFGGGVGPDDFTKAIRVVSQGIVDAAIFFANVDRSIFKGGPTKEWSDGVGGAIGAFSPVFKALHEDSGWFTSSDDVIKNMTNAVKSISQSIVDVATNFSSAGNIWTNYPTADWTKNIGQAITSFADLVKNLKGYENSGFKSLIGADPITNISNGMIKIAGAYDRLARAIKNFGSALNGLDIVKVNAFRSLTANLAMLSAMDSTMFSNMLKVIESRSGVFANLLKSQTAEITKRPGVNVAGAAGAAGQGKKVDESYMRDNKGETQLQKLDKVVALLSELRNSARSIDEHLQNPKMKKNEDIGAKGDD